MERALNPILRFLRDEEGVTAIEYGLIAALIAVVIIAGLAAVGTNLDTLFDNIANCLSNPSATCFGGGGAGTGG